MKLKTVVAAMLMALAAVVIASGCKQTVTVPEAKDKTPPKEVTNLKAVTGYGKISLSWTNPTDADLHQVEITASPAAGSLANPVYLSAEKGKAMSFTAEGLSNGTAYTFTVKTIDKALNKSTGVKTETAVAPIDTSDKTPPAEVTTLKGDAGNGKVFLSWKNPGDADLYQVEVSASPAAGTLTNPVYLSAVKGAAGSFMAEGLTGGQEYTFTVKTIDKTLNVGTAVTVKATPQSTGGGSTIDTTAPAEVTELTAIAGNGKVSLSWKNPGDADLYQVEISTSPAAGTLTNPVYLSAVKGAAGSFMAEGLTGGQEYTFTVKTIDKTLNVGTAVTVKATPQSTGGGSVADTTAPAEVGNLQAEALAGAIRLTWQDPADEDLWGIEITSQQKIVTRSIAPIPENAILVAKGQQSRKISNLTVGQSYTFTIKTIDNSGNKSAGIKTTTVTPKAGEPMTLTLEQNPEKTVWTKDSVTITVKSNTSIKEAKWKEGSGHSAKDVLENGTTITGNSFTVNESGIYSVVVQDNDGRREVETIEIKNIDKEPPAAPTNLTAEYRFGEKKIILKWSDPVDTASGLKELKLSYTVNGANEKTETIAKGVQSLEIENVNPQSPPVPYVFSLKAVDNAGNEGTEATVSIKPSEQAEVTGITVSRKKIDKNDPDRKVTVTIQGSNLTKAEEIKITGRGTIVCTNITDSRASAEFDLPDREQSYTFRVSVKQAGAASAAPVQGVEAKTQVCEPANITNMEVTKQNGGYFKIDQYGDFKVEPNTGGEMKIVLTGTNLDIDEAKAGVNFNGLNYDGSANADGTRLTIERIPVPTDSGFYPIKAQVKPRYETEYIIVPDSTNYYGYKSRRLRVLGNIVLKELWLPGYNKDDEGTEAWLVIKGENFDTLTSDQLANITSSLGATVTDAKVKDSITLEAIYSIPDLPDDSVIGKTETITVAGKTVSSPLHTLKIRKDSNKGKYVVNSFYSIPDDGNPRVPAYIDEIDSNAFKDCTNLTSLDLSATKLTEIRFEAFKGCTELTSVNFPQSLTEISSDAFRECTKLASIDLSATKLTRIRNETFKGCAGLTSVNFPQSLTNIDNYAFVQCTKLASIDLSATKLTEIGYSSFYNCTGLISVSLPQSLEKFGSYDNRPGVFYGCTKLASIDLSVTKLTEIANDTFRNCTELTSVNFPQSLTKIGKLTFFYCTKLASVDLSGCNRLTEIGEEAFYQCTELTSVQFPASLITIGYNAFRNCQKLTSAVFADSTGWAVYNYSNYKDKTADIQKTDLENAGTAAGYLRKNRNNNGYCDTYWKKN